MNAKTMKRPATAFDPEGWMNTHFPEIVGEDFICRACNIDFNNPEKLVKHLEKKHGVPVLTLKKHKSTRALMGFGPMEDFERTFVKGYKQDHTKFVCLGEECNGKVVPKRACERNHFLKVHNLAVEMTKHWHVVRNGHAIKNSNDEKASILAEIINEETLDEDESNQGYDTEEDNKKDEEDNDEEEEDEEEAGDDAGENDEEEEDEEDEEENTETKESLVDQNSVANSLRQAMQDQLAALQSMMRDMQNPGGGPEIVVPRLHLRGEVKKFVDYPEEKCRYKYPFPETAPSDELKLFQQWLPSLRAMNSDTVELTIKQLRRLKSFFREENDQPFSYEQLFLAIYGQSLLPELVSLPIMNMKYSWPKIIVQSMSHYAAFLTVEFTKQNKPFAKSQMEVFQRDELQRLLKRAQKQKKTQARKKHRLAGVIIQDWPEVQTLKVAVLQAMVLLQILSTKLPSNHVMQLATVAMVGILYFNGMGGRPMEWKLMLKEYIADCLSKNLTCVVCTEHKTARTHGDLGKHIFPGTAKAMSIYIALAGHSVATFLQCNPNTSLTKYLQCFIKLFLPNAFKGTITITLVRKFFHTRGVHLAREHGFIKTISEADPHSTRVAREVYVCDTPQADAHMSMLIYLHVMGAPVDFPDPQLPKIQELSSYMERVADLHADPLPLLDSVASQDDDEDNDNDEEFEIPVPAATMLPLANSEPENNSEDQDEVPEDQATLDPWLEPCTLVRELRTEPDKKERKSPYKLTIPEEAWIKLQAEPTIFGGFMPSACQMRAILQLGLETGKLREGATFDGVRGVIRKTYHPAASREEPPAKRAKAKAASSSSKD